MSSPIRLDHLTGIRSLLALWIVCGHYLPHEKPTSFLAASTCRSFMAVDVFVVMSGFVTHWAYGDRLQKGELRIRQFYVRRMAGIVLTTYIAMVLSLIVVIMVPEFRNSFMPSALTLLGCFSFLAHWVKPSAWCPAPPSWTIEVLIPSWLLYPFTRRLVDGVDSRAGTPGLVLLIAALHALSFGPLLLLFLLQGFKLTWVQYATDFFWPPSQLADFAIGVVAAALAQKSAIPDNCREEGHREAEETGALHGYSWQGLLADLSFFGTAAVVIWMPPPANRAECETNESALLTHGLALPIAAWLALSVHGGLVARILSHQALVALGNYSSEVYLFKWPLVALFHHVFQQWPLPLDVFMAFLLLLWLLSGVYVEFLAPPLVRHLRASLELFIDWLQVHATKSEGWVAGSCRGRRRAICSCRCHRGSVS
ncbi:unnamed protein product [Polarella glacialis]|uniref:Acyltransferase 3 domain-containing protein n=1 Tax=Polarella glacialis TaxID=89957 RepID=A0A813KWX5_POLGL|nr:unnamed protein product [Polarella glacialis]